MTRRAGDTCGVAKTPSASAQTADLQARREYWHPTGSCTGGAPGKRGSCAAAARCLCQLG